MYMALKEQIPFVDINQERHTAYAGYEGLMRLAKQLVSAMENPVWQMVRTPAPWDRGE
ncbi:hypothetical protein D3C72_2574910 [compost metagenome]